MFKSSKKSSPGMDRQSTALWLGRALSSDQVTMQALLQLVHIVGVQQQAIQALALRQAGQAPEPEQQEALDLVRAAENALLSRLAELEAELQPVLKAVEQACAELEKEIR
jgi:hypothetical protein